MKKNLRVFFLFTLVALFATVANARQVSLQTDQVTGSKYVIVPETDIDTLVVDGSTSFKVFDAGHDGDYDDDDDGYLLLVAPEGFTFHISGSGTLADRNDCLTMFDGPEGDERNPWQEFCGEGFEANASSSGNVVKLHFYSDGSQIEAGFELSIEPSIDAVNMPVTGELVLNVPAGSSFKLYDDGGKDGDCTEDADGALVLKAPEGYVFELEGSIYVHSYDLLAVLNGSSGTDTLTKWSGYIPHVGPVYSSQSTIVIAFKQTGYVALSGFDFTVGVVQVSEHTISVANTAGGTITPSTYSSDPGAPITLTATPDDGYYLSEVVIEGTVGHESVYVEGGKWYTKDTAAFIMPNKDVTITPVFVQGVPFVNMPTTLGDGITIKVSEKVTSFKIYDDGGAVGNYSDNVDGTIEMDVPAGYTLQISGTLNSADNNDLLSLSSGRQTIWDRLSGDQTLDPFETDGSFSLRFSSNGSGNASGLDITVTLTPKASQTVTLASGLAGTVTLNGSPVSAGGSVEVSQDAVVNLNITPNTGYMLNGVEVVGEDGNPVTVTGGEWYSNNTASFTMPGQSVTVTPNLVRTQDVTELAIKVPGDMSMTPSGMPVLEVTLPEEYTTFKVYDAGGRDGHFNGGGGTLVLTAPAGKVLQVSGNVVFAEMGEMMVYDGYYSEESAYDPTEEPLAYLRTSASVAPVVTTGNVVTIGFMVGAVMMGEEGDNDLDLTVTVTDAPEPKAITVVQADGGTISASQTEAVMGKNIIVTANCNQGFLLESVTVEDSEGNPVTVTGGLWYSGGSASFKMPANAVTVTPVFTDSKKSAEDGLFVNLTPMTQPGPSPEVSIPEGVQSFYVYDDGGRNGNFALNTAAICEFVAPSDYLLRLKGSMDIGDDRVIVISKGQWAMDGEEELYGTQESVGPYVNSRLGVALYPMGPESISHAGFAFKVTVVKPAQYAAVTVAEDGGKLVATIDGAYDENDAVNISEETEVDTVVFNRTFSTAGYSTITLPFAIDVNKVDGLAHAYEFDEMGLDASGKKEVRMAEVNSLAANTPYIIEVDDETLVFHGGVTIEATQTPMVKKGDWEFRGILQKKTWSAGDEDLGRVYGYSAEATDKVTIGQFVKAAAGAWIRPLRAYLIYNPDDGLSTGKTAGSALGTAEPLPDYMNVVVVSRDANGQEHKKVIGGIDTRTGEFKMQQDYDLKGRKLMNGQQKARGAYYGKMKVSK